MWKDVGVRDLHDGVDGAVPIRCLGSERAKIGPLLQIVAGWSLRVCMIVGGWSVGVAVAGLQGD